MVDILTYIIYVFTECWKYYVFESVNEMSN